MLKCTTCNTEYEDQESFREHCKELWHTYNLKRKVAGLGPITQQMFEEKTRLADAKGKGKGKGKKAKDGASPPKPRSPPKEEVPWTPVRCLFDDHVCPTVEENVEYMQSKYSFFVPDREYLVKPLEMLTMLHEKIYEDSTCIFCNKIFATPQNCLMHMKDLGHTRIGTDTTILCGELEPFYDFSNSKSELVTKLKPKHKKGEEKEADTSTTPSESDAGADEANEREEGEEGGEWEDCSDCSDDDALEVVECEDEDEFKEILAEYGLQRTEILPSGDLRLPNGAIATHRRYAYVYKQRFKPHQQEEKVQKRLALSLAGTPWAASKMKALTNHVGGGAGRGLQGVQAVACGTRLVKTHQRQVVAILKKQQSEAMKLGIHHNNSNMKKFQSKVKVNLYSWAK